MNTKLYSELASLIQARLNCLDTGNAEWKLKHEEKIESIVSEYLPSGSGFDSGVRLEIDLSRANRLEFYAPFHHMDEWGGYDGWTEHMVIVTPSLAFGFDLRITGKNKNQIKDHISEVFIHALNTEIEK